MARVTSGVLLLLVLWSFLAVSDAGVDWQWRTGRATNYGGPGDPWSIHHGSCNYKYLDPTVNKGWDVAALPDAVHDYKGSCGRCYEIGCAPMHLKDGYGTGLDRSHVCFDTTKTVVVMITDSCPCDYPPNAYSNKRWCCADYYHFDMSTWAFEKLAERKWGVIGVRYREVPCDYCPDQPATLPSGASPSPAAEGAPGGWQPSWDKRPYGKQCFRSSMDAGPSGSSNSDKSTDSSSSATAGATAYVSGSSSSGSGSGSNNNNGGGSGGGSSNSGGGSSNSGGGSQQSPWFTHFSFPSNSLFSGWQDLTSKLVDPWSATGPDGKSAYCGTLDGYGSVVFKGSTGSMMGKTKLSVDVKTENGQVPDFSLSLSSTSKGSCRTIDLRSVQGATRNGDWATITIPLANVSWWTSSWWSTNASPFSGCSQAIGAWDLNQVELKNKWGGRQGLCLANIKAF